MIKKYRIIIFIAAGLIFVAGIVWIVISVSNQKTDALSPAATITMTPSQISETGTPDTSGMATAEKTVSPTTSPGITSSPAATPSVSSPQTVSSTPTQTTTAAPTQTDTPQPTQTATAAPTQTAAPTPTQTATATPEPTPAFSYSVYNDDGVAPAGYTIVYIKVTPYGSYHVTYDGKTITKSKSGSDYITYYTTVEKLEDGNYRSKVSVTAN